MQQYKLLIGIFGILLLVSVIHATDFCYQETANVSTVCGGLDTGSYSFTSEGEWYQPEYTYDGDWDTFGSHSSGVGQSVMYINYTKPVNVLNSSLFSFKHSIEESPTVPGQPFNMTISSTCWNPLTLQLKTTSNYGNNGDWVYWVTAECWDNNNWIVMYQEPIGNCQFAGIRIYEEAMWWDINGSPLEVQETMFNLYDDSQIDFYEGGISTFFG